MITRRQLLRGVAVAALTLPLGTCAALHPRPNPRLRLAGTRPLANGNYVVVVHRSLERELIEEFGS